MICTFGDITDVTWWRELDLPTRAVIGRDGRLLADAPDWIAPTHGRARLRASSPARPSKQAQRAHRRAAARVRRPGRRARSRSRTR